MSLKFFLILTLCVIYVNAASNIFYSLKLILGLEREMYEIIDTAVKNENEKRSIINDMMTTAIYGFSGCNKNSKEINDKLTDISSQLKYIARHMDDEFGIIEKAMHKLSLQVKINPVKREITDYITNMRRHYMMTAKYSNDTESYHRDELESVIETLTNQTSGKDIRSSLASLSDIIVGPENNNLTPTFLKLYEEYVKKEGVNLCGTGLSPNTYLYNLYTIVVSTEIIGLVSLSFGYELQHKLHNAYFPTAIEKELETAQKERQKRLKNYFANFKKAIESSALDYRSCDPPKHNRGETFFEMESLFQTVLTEEFGKNSHGSCVGGCETINMTTSFEDNEIICRRIYRCLPLKNPIYCELTGQSRRYQWIKLDDSTLIDGSTCSGIVKRKAQFNGRKGLCETCHCSCESNLLRSALKNPNSTHVISLLPVSTDISNNMTITGLRLKVKDGIVHIQTKEGQLQTAGQVMKNSAWKDVPDMKTEVNRARSNKFSVYKEGRDFHVVDYNYNSINLGDVLAPPGYLITGIKWGITEEKETGWRLGIQIRCTPFNFTSGALGNSSESQWMSSPTIPTQHLHLPESDSPEKSTAPTIPSEPPEQWIQFIPSDFDKDAGQSTTPFLDGVPVESASGPLTGIRLFHKAAEGYAGFLSFRLYSLDMAKYMTVDLDLPQNQANKKLEGVDSSGSAQRILSD